MLFPKRPVYLPAFRSILEAASSREDYRIYYESDELRNHIVQVEAHERRNSRMTERPAPYPFGPFGTTAVKTVLSRRWFGDFVPVIRYPSLADVSRQLKDEAQRAYIQVNQSNQSTFSTVFSEVLKAVQQGLTPRAREDVHTLFKRVQKRMQAVTPSHQSAGEQVNPPPQWRIEEEKSFRTVLEIYDNALAIREAEEARAYSRLRLFEESINRFIQPKELRVSQPGVSTRREPRVFLSKEQSEKLEVLSSGERQVLTMLFCATHMSEADGVMLIDEPEISLHVDWQRIILDEIIKQAGDRQIIACTHAPEVVAEHRGSLVLLDSTQQQSALPHARVEDDGDVNEGD